MKRVVAKIVLFSKLWNCYLDLSPLPPPASDPRQNRGAKSQPQGQLECSNPQGSLRGMVRLGID